MQLKIIFNIYFMALKRAKKGRVLHFILLKILRKSAKKIPPKGGFLFYYHRYAVEQRQMGRVKDIEEIFHLIFTPVAGIAKQKR